ncbi:MAG: 50S ribosomal protein L3 [Elusimicrobia bacterium]|nr:50S ribosomal protein L3 [Elusimicrobiota bacterium]
MKSIIGTKMGMTQLFDKSGNIVPVTVVSAGPCIVTEIRTKEKDGYSAVQLGYGDVLEKSLSKPIIGQFKKRNLALKKHLYEFRTEEVADLKVGQEIKTDVFQEADFVDVSGVSKGRGYAGVVKRYGFRGGPSTHGQSDRQRAPGASGAGGNQRVLKGTKKPGHLGDGLITIQRLQIIGIDPEKNILLVKGALPGTVKGTLIINKTVKKVKARSAETAQKTKKKFTAPSKAAKANK